MSEPTYEIYAIKYARLFRRSPENFVGGDPHDTEMPLFYYVWLISGFFIKRSLKLEADEAEEVLRK